MERSQEVFQIAFELFRQDPDWVVFFREVLGLNGLVRQAYPAEKQLAHFQQSKEYAQIQLMLAKLRERGVAKPAPPSPTKVITVRVPTTVHNSLTQEAHFHKVSMNSLCIAKLLQAVDARLIHEEANGGRDMEKNRAGADL